MKIIFRLWVYTFYSPLTMPASRKKLVALISTETNNSYPNMLTYVDKKLAKLHDATPQEKQTWKSYPRLKKL